MTYIVLEGAGARSEIVASKGGRVQHLVCLKAVYLSVTSCMPHLLATGRAG